MEIRSSSRPSSFSASVSLSAGTKSILSGFSPVFAQENPAHTRPARVFEPKRVRRPTLQPTVVISDLLWTQRLQAARRGRA